MPDSDDKAVANEVENLRSENDRLSRRLSQLSDLSRRITSTLDLETVLRDVITAACDLTDARYGALGVFDEQGVVEQFITHGISDKERARIGDLPKGQGLLGLLQHEQKPLRFADIAAHESSVGFPANHPSMHSFLGVPIRLDNEPLGNIYLTEKQSAVEFTSEDEDVLILFASQAALSINNSKKFEAERRARVDVEEATAALAAERQRLEVLVDTSPIGVIVAEAKGGAVLLVNREAERLFEIAFEPGDNLSRYEQAAVYKRPDGRTYDTEDLPLQRAIYRGETARAEEVRFVLPSGRAIPTLVNATPLFSADGRITAGIAVIQDISPLDEIHKLRNEFLGMVSHELRTPLTAIKGSAATVLGSQTHFDPAEIRQFFEIIDEQADRLRDLVNNLLDMTRIEAGTLSVNPKPFELREALGEASTTFRQNGGTQDVVAELPEQMPLINADRYRITQVFNNLLSNAGKFSPGSETIDVSIEYDDTFVTIQVSDSGRGVPPEMLPHLFRKFSQVHADHATTLSGTGLGLAICRGIVEAHGGRIFAESAGEGTGTTFTFTLPVVADQPSQPEMSQRSEHMGRVSRPGQRTRILAVDDEQQVLRYLQNTLQQAGYQLSVSSDAEEAVSLVEMEQPELVLLDLILPGASGFDILRKIREFSGVPVIMLSGRDNEEDTVQALRLGADDYIVKPFSGSELLARIEASLRRRVLRDQIEVEPPYEVGGLHVEFAARQVTVDGQEVKLTATEYKLLYELATNSGRVLTHDQILQRVWGPEYSGESQLVRAFIRNLRRKLGDDANNPRYIFTEPQVGYRMPRP